MQRANHIHILVISSQLLNPILACSLQIWSQADLLQEGTQWWCWDPCIWRQSHGDFRCPGGRKHACCSAGAAWGRRHSQGNCPIFFSRFAISESLLTTFHRWMMSIWDGRRVRKPFFCFSAYGSRSICWCNIAGKVRKLHFIFPASYPCSDFSLLISDESFVDYEQLMAEGGTGDSFYIK